MPDANDLARDLWIALAQPESLDQVVETYRQIEDLAEASTLPAGSAGDLRAQAFSAMKGIAGEDPIRSKALILRLLLPLCLAGSSDTDRRMSVPYYGEILREWLEALSSSGSTSIRDEVL